MAIGPIVPKQPTMVEPKSGEQPIIRVEPPQTEFEQKRSIIRTKRILWYVLIVIEVILLFRFLLKFFGANLSSGFSALIVTISTPFVFLFENLFPPTISPQGTIIIEWSTLFAMVAYAIIGWLISRFYKLRKPIDPQEAEEKVEETNP